MAFTRSGNIITQTAGTTDDNFDGIIGLANQDGIDISPSGGGTLKRIITFSSSITLAFRGTMNHDVEREELVFQDPPGGSVPTLLIANGATYNLGVEKGPSGPLAGTGVYTDGVGWNFLGNSNTWFSTTNAVGNGASLSILGTLNINGGRAYGRMSVYMRGAGGSGGNAASGRINNVYGAKWIVSPATSGAGSEWLARIYDSPILTTSNFDYEGGSIGIGDGSQTGTFPFNRTNAGVGYWAQHDFINRERGTRTGFDFDGSDTTTYATLDNVAFTNNIVDVAVRTRGRGLSGVFRPQGIRIRNSANGSLININGGEGVNNLQNNGGYHWITRQISTDFQATDGSGGVTGTLFVRDRDSGFRTIGRGQTATAQFAQFQDNVDNTYRFSVANGAISDYTPAGGYSAATCCATQDENEIVLGIVNVSTNLSNPVDLTSDINRPRATIAGPGGVTVGTGVWTMDKRGWGPNDNTGTDQGVLGEDFFPMHFWSYETVYLGIRPNLRGTGVLNLQQFIGLDSQITLSRADVTALNTAQFGTRLSATNQAITITGNGNMISDTNIYDLIKFRKETVANQIEFPTASTTVVTRANGVNNYANRNITASGTGNTLTGSHSMFGALSVGGATNDATLSGDSITATNTTDTTLTVTGTATLSGTAHSNLDATAQGTIARINFTGNSANINDSTIVGDFEYQPGTTFTNVTAADNALSSRLQNNTTFSGGTIGITFTNPGNNLTVRGPGRYGFTFTESIAANLTWSVSGLRGAGDWTMPVPAISAGSTLTINTGDTTTRDTLTTWAAGNARIVINFIEDRTLTVAGAIEDIRMRGGSFHWRVAGTNTFTDVTINNATTIAQLTVTRRNDSTDEIEAWYKPASSGTTIYDYAYLRWDPSTTGSVAITPFQPDPSNIVTGDTAATTFPITAATTTVPYTDTAGTAGTGVMGRFTINSDANTNQFNIGNVLAMSRDIGNFPLYMQIITRSGLTGTNNDRVQSFAATTAGSGLLFASQATGNNRIILLSANSQKTLTNASNVRTENFQAAPVPQVVSSAIVTVFGSVAQVRDAVDLSTVLAGVNTTVNTISNNVNTANTTLGTVATRANQAEIAGWLDVNPSLDPTPSTDYPNNQITLPDS